LLCTCAACSLLPRTVCSFMLRMLAVSIFFFVCWAASIAARTSACISSCDVGLRAGVGVGVGVWLGLGLGLGQGPG
jgi:hypothetical protein